MKLQIKLVLYNAISKALIISALAVIIPLLIQKIVYNHLDKRLYARQEKMLRMIRIGGLNEITIDQDCSFDSYNIFKEEFVSISPLAALPQNFEKSEIENTQRVIDHELIKHRVISKAFIYDNQIYKLEIGEGLSSAEELSSSIRNFTLKIMIAVVLFSIFFDLGFAQILLRPFNKIISNKLKNVTHPSSFNTAPVSTTTYEFSQLDRSVNEMMNQIQEAFKLERDFITNVSHELLTPISILKNRVENMINDPSLPEEAVIKLVDSQKTLSRLSRIIKALLYISRIENEQFLKSETASIPLLVKDVLEEAEVLIQDRNILLNKDNLDSFLFSPCNPTLLHTLILNLISNAIKYNRPGGSIIITGRMMQDGYHFSVKDSGIGIAKDQLPFIFDRFKRLRPEDDKGFGLGLPIVKSIADFHAISIHVTSIENEGTDFELIFPATST